MFEYNILLLLHILLFVYWLGGDLGVFYSSRYVCNSALGSDARGISARIMLALDLAPRVCLVLILPVGLNLAAILRLIPLNTPSLALIWVISFAWLSMVIAIYKLEHTRMGEVLQKIDFCFRILVVVLLLSVALTSLFGDGMVDARWLAIKLLIFSMIVTCGLVIRVLLKPFGADFGALMQTGSTPEIEKRLSSTIARVKPFVLLIWLGLVIEATLGIVKI